MKNIIILSLSLLIITTSCKKNVIKPSDETNTTNNKIKGGVSKWGVFLLIGSKKLVKNNQTGEKTSYNDFGNSSRGSLRWGGSLFDIENIIKDTTTWSFYQPKGMDGKFVLNNDTTHFYLVHYTSSFTTIIEDYNNKQQNMGGSARPITGETVDLINKIIHIYVQTEIVEINGNSSEVLTELTFKKIQEF